MKLFWSVFVLLLAGRCYSLEQPCGPEHVALPRTLEEFECVTVERLKKLQLAVSATVRFDADSRTRFFLWTQSTAEGEREELMFNNRSSLTDSSFDARNPTRILIHGWLSDWSSEVVVGLAKAYQAKGAYNVIGVDWSAGASTPIYMQARHRVEAVATTLAKQVALLLAVGQQPSQIVLIGHSLGAHVAGLTGKHFPGSESKLAAVVALDPAGPLFSETDPSERVDRFDAQYVEVIHTNGRFLGHHATLGEADFFPNGGRKQAGCLTNGCSHHRAVEYFRRSLEASEPVYIGRQCVTEAVSDKCDGSQAVMGADPNERYKTKKSGMFYVKIDK